RKIHLMRRFLVLALAASALLSWAPDQVRAAADGQNRGRSGAAPAPASQPSGPLAEAVPFVNKQLPNGLDVVILEDHSVPLVTVELAVRNGSFTEPPELNGLSHLFEHMFFKSNRATANSEDYLQRIGQLGVAYNGSTREEIVNYYFTTTTPNFPVALRLMRDSIRFPLFDEREFAREQQVVI